VSRWERRIGRSPVAFADQLLLLELDEDDAMHGDAVAVAFALPEGISWVWLPPLGLELLALLPLLPLLELELEDSVHGGTTSTETLLLAGTTSSFCGVCPELACCAEPPPGVSRIVLDGGGVAELLLPELLELLELLELEGA
jgi:hypothetical protein